MAQAFLGQRKDEKILFLFRRHIITMRRGLYFMLLFTLLGCVPPLIWASDSRMYLSFVIGFALGLSLWFYYYIMWYFTVYIVTDERIRQVSQKSFFKKTVIDLDLSRVESVSYSIPGFFGSIYGYGTIVVQTLVGDLVISYVRHPEETYNKLQNTISFMIKKRGRNDQEIDKKEAK